jgi:predicted MFS family arabinose efflux permease
MSPRQWALLLMLSGNMLLDALEVSTVVVAMPSIGRGLGLSTWAASWTMTGFALGFGGSILPGARLAVRIGRRRVYLGALLIFAVASVAAGLAVDGPMLIATRVVKGICVALTAPTGLAIIATTFDEGPQRDRAVSVYSLFGASGFSAGLLLAGALTMVSWRWTLLFSGPIALVLLVFGLLLIPADSTITVRPFDFRAAATGTLLRSAAGAAALNGPYWGFLLLVTFQTRSAMATGLVLLPTSVPLLVSSLFSGRMVRRFGAGRLILAGSLSALLGYVWYAGHGAPLPTVLFVGVGFMLSFAALHVQAITGVPPEAQGVVSGVYQTSVQIGGAVTLALVAALNHGAATVLVASVAAAGVVIAIAGRPGVRKGASCPSRSLSS